MPATRSARAGAVEDQRTARIADAVLSGPAPAQICQAPVAAPPMPSRAAHSPDGPGRPAPGAAGPTFAPPARRGGCAHAPPAALHRGCRSRARCAARIARPAGRGRRPRSAARPRWRAGPERCRCPASPDRNRDGRRSRRSATCAASGTSLSRRAPTSAQTSVAAIRAPARIVKAMRGGQDPPRRDQGAGAEIDPVLAAHPRQCGDIGIAQRVAAPPGSRPRPCAASHPPRRRGEREPRRRRSARPLFLPPEIDRDDIGAVLDRLGHGRIVLRLLMVLEARLLALRLELEREIDRRIDEAGDRREGDGEPRRRLVEAKPDLEPFAASPSGPRSGSG